jgi:RNA polymerase sigma factor (TIGR02999 family)
MREDGLDSLVVAADEGNADARKELFATLYRDLHRLAERALRRAGGGITLSPTTLLHEAYLSVSGRDSVVFPDRARFMAYAARSMRGLVIDYARRRCAQKRGGGFDITSLPTEVPELAVDDTELTRIADSLEDLATVDPRLVEVVDLKFFCGFSFAEIAAMREVSERTVQRDWDKARIFLHRSLQDHAGGPACALIEEPGDEK